MRAPRLAASWYLYDQSARRREYGDIVSPDGEIALSPELQIEADFFAGRLGGLACVLDVGCGLGFPALVLAPHVGCLVALDAAPTMVSRLRSHAQRLGLDNIRIVRADAEALPSAGCRFDGAAICGTLGSLTNPELMLDDLHRALQPGAIVACVAENLADKLRLDRGKELRWFRMDEGQLSLRVVEYLRNPYRIRDYRYLIGKDGGLYRQLLAEHEGSLSWRTPTEQEAADLPLGIVVKAIYDEAVQYDPATLQATFERAGFGLRFVELRRHLPVEHIFAAFERR
jgi:SAM-dependent methyltransferase